MSRSRIGDLEVRIEALEENVKSLGIAKSEMESQNQVLEANNLEIAQKLSQIQSKN